MTYAQAPRRPLLVWVIVIFMLLGSGWSLLSLYLVGSGTIPLTPEQESYFSQLTPFDYAVSVAGAVVNLVAAVALFMLRRVAVPLFLLSLVLAVAASAWHAWSKGWTEALGGPGLIGALIGFVLLAAICLYAWSLDRRGVLR